MLKLTELALSVEGRGVEAERCTMALVRSMFGRVSRDTATNRGIPNNFVRLSEAEIVCDEPQEVAVRQGESDASAIFAVGAAARAPLFRPQNSLATKETLSPHEAAWAGSNVDLTLGQLITETRERRGLSLEQVASQTRMPMYYAKMIESDNYDAIPDPLYLLPFFRSCAILLGLDAEKVVLRFIRDFEKAENEVVGTSVRSTTDSKALLTWRMIATAAVVTGILLPCIAWGIGIMGTTLRHQTDNSSAAPVLPNTLPPSAILSKIAPHAASDQQAAQAPTVATIAHAITSASAKPQIDQQQHTQAKRQKQRTHRHRLSRIP
jgi:cytoskeletal protein RodZ